jgi:hypothetical protein
MMRRALNRRLDGLEQRESDELPASLLEWLGEASGRSRRNVPVIGTGIEAAAGLRWLNEREITK